MELEFLKLARIRLKLNYYLFKQIAVWLVFI